MMDASIETLFNEHSFEEIESVRDNLANEIEKRTELLKSIVKEKYRDIVETSDAIQSMKINLKEVEQSLWSLDKSISDFYARAREPKVDSSKSELVQPGSDVNDSIQKCATDSDDLVKRLFNYSSQIWENFDSGNLAMSVELLDDYKHLLEANRNELALNHKGVVENLTITLNRAEEMVKNSLWYRIQVAAPDQVGIIAGSDQEKLYQLSLSSSIGFLVETFHNDISDTSYHAQIRRYQPCSYLNSQTNQIEPDVKAPASGYTQIPKQISPELNAFLYQICKVVNTIAGSNLNRCSIVDSLSVTLEHILAVYSDIVHITRPKRALQLYFDLLYLRILLNTSKNVDLVERLDPKIAGLTNKFELMLDSIELYTISPALHLNVMALSKSTIRLYGLLIPHLQ